jgi:hypothetical protein
MRTLILLVLAAAPALPSTITYEFLATVSGRWAGVNFTNQTMRLTTVAEYTSPFLPGPATIEIGSQTGTIQLQSFFINAGSCSFNQEFPSVNSCVGVVAAPGLDLIAVANNTLVSYAAKSAATGVTDATPITNLGFNFTTSLGSLRFTSMRNGSFNASVQHLPEPSTWTMLGVGAGLLLLGRRAKSLA